MSEPSLQNRLEQIQESIAAIESYIGLIQSPEDFLTGQGVMIFDAIVMRLQVLGENIKTLYKRKPEMFIDIEKEVISIIRFRDLISHHYEKLDNEIVFEIATAYLPILRKKIELLN